MLSLPEKFSQESSCPQGGIVLIDSGVGALMISRTIQEVLPGVPLVAIGDQLHFPYGSKDEGAIGQRIIELAEFAVRKFDPRVIVIACNTASTFILPTLRQRYKVPIVGVVPPIKPAAENYGGGVIAILATRGTSKRVYLANLISEFSLKSQVKVVACEELARLAELKFSGKEVRLADLRYDLGALLEVNLDSVVLGCTHFSFLRDEIRALLGGGVEIHDPSEAVAQQVFRVYKGPKVLSCKESWFLTTSKKKYSNEKSYDLLGIDRVYCI
jgi:glutamate racemase